MGDDLNDNVTECQPSILMHVKLTSTFIGSALMALPANSEEIFILLLINLLTSLCRRLPKSLNIVDPPDKTKYIIHYPDFKRASGVLFGYVPMFP